MKARCAALLLCMGMAVWGASAVAQTAGEGTVPGFSLHSASEINQRSRPLLDKARLAKDGLATEPWERYGDHSAILAARVAPGQGELHTKAADYYYVLQGSAMLVVGGSLDNRKETGPGEVRGDRVIGGLTRKVGPGDLVHIPPNTPHQMITQGQPIVYLLFKVAE